MRIALPLVITLILSCRPAPDQKRPLPTTISPAALVRAYRDTPGLARNAWTGRYVEITLPGSSYQLRNEEIHWNITTDISPTIVFEGRHILNDSKSPVRISGRCEGDVPDGKHHGPGIEFYIRVVDCLVQSGPQ